MIQFQSIVEEQNHRQFRYSAQLAIPPPSREEISRSHRRENDTYPCQEGTQQTTATPAHSSHESGRAFHATHSSPTLQRSQGAVRQASTASSRYVRRHESTVQASGISNPSHFKHILTVRRSSFNRFSIIPAPSISLSPKPYHSRFRRVSRSSLRCCFGKFASTVRWSWPREG